MLAPFGYCDDNRQLDTLVDHRSRYEQRYKRTHSSSMASYCRRSNREVATEQADEDHAFCVVTEPKWCGVQCRTDHGDNSQSPAGERS